MLLANEVGLCRNPKAIPKRFAVARAGRRRAAILSRILGESGAAHHDEYRYESQLPIVVVRCPSCQWLGSSTTGFDSLSSNCHFLAPDFWCHHGVGGPHLLVARYVSLNPRSGRPPYRVTPLYSGVLSVKLEGSKGETLWSYLVTSTAPSEDISKALSTRLRKCLAEALEARK